jgi:hypothetical protein
LFFGEHGVLLWDEFDSDGYDCAPEHEAGDEGQATHQPIQPIQ